MTTFDRFERSIPELMQELAPARVPDYFDDMLRQTARYGQRPAWSYPERWLPVEITARPLSTRSFPWRPLAILALIALLVAAALAVYIGSANRVPPPFGIAGNGVLLYRAADGSIASLDPATGARATVAPASQQLRDPVPSRDGRRIALTTFFSTATTPITVKDLSGGPETALSGDYREIDAVDWSPDGKQLAIVSNQGGLQSITVAASDGSSARTLSIGRQVSFMTYLPDGRIAVVAADRPEDQCPGDDPTVSPCALFVVDADGSGLDRLIASADFHGINTIDPSADGTNLLWVEWKAGSQGRLHLFDLATHVDSRVDDSGFPTRYEMNHAWLSPDGTSILFDLFETGGDHWAVVPVSGGTPTRIGQKVPQNGTEAVWAPDGRSVLARYPTSDTTSELWLLDPSGRTADRRIDGEVPYLPAWQRVAPPR